VHLEASTKPYVHRKFEIFWTNIAPQWPAQTLKMGQKMDFVLQGLK
jgi:hypothetical protein